MFDFRRGDRGAAEVAGAGREDKINKIESYLNREELGVAVSESCKTALRRAALEAFEGRHDATELEGMVDRDAIEREALEIVMPRS
jgi:hypothetical protein